ncbi:MAG: hypothetical protein AB1543_09225, partial [Candidatus Bipolaricaulota bacterium]
LLSPAKQARWLQPVPSKGDLHELWHARLDPERGGRDVRAIWARDMDLGFLRNVKGPEDEAGEDAAFKPGLGVKSRREVVVLSSVYGLPALRRDPQPGGGTPQGSPGPYRLPGEWRFLGADEGVYGPEPLASAEIILSSQGGTFFGKGAWEPPTQQGGMDPAWSGLSVQRWDHRAYLGRDTYVEVQRKGFLFPIGHRVTWVTRTERKFFVHPEKLEPVAYLMQRQFILIGKPLKNFPGPSQPFGGREWPAASIELITRQTPDLEDPTTDLGGKIALPGGVAFWPTVTRNKPPFSFRMRVNGKGGEATGPLIFVDNAAANDPQSMAKLVEYYHKAEVRLRQIAHRGERRAYAPSRKPGQTELDTTTWTLRSRGPLKTGDATGAQPSDFIVSPIMNGADQPPFYPVLEKANVRLQSVERLIDSDLGGVDVRPAWPYVLDAFDPVANGGELYLEVLDPIQLDFSGAGASASGFAHPNARISHLSRTVGPVGGRGAAPEPAERRGLAPSSSGPRSSAEAGQFDPLEFFGGALNEAKLLGLVPLREIIRPALMSAAPRLLEVVEYGAELIDQVLASLD